MKRDDITGIILAGGKSSRMGEDKGLLSLNGQPMIQHVIDRLEDLNLSRILIVSNNPEYAQFTYPVIEDVIKEKGPLGGIHAGLLQSKTNTNLILSCDTPNVPLSLLEFLLDQSKDETVTISKFNDKEHPLIGVYQRDVLTKVENNLMNDELKLMKLCLSLNAKVLTIPEEMAKEVHFSNVNTPQELENLSK